MGGSQVMFETPSAFTKKRKRMVGTNAKSKVEVKQWNPRYPGEGDTYNSVNLVNPFNVSLYNPAVVGGSWMPFDINLPSQGTSAHQRIGNSIFLKYLRFKGYLRVYKRAPIGVRWRIRLLRCDNFKFSEVPSGGDGGTRHKEYVALFHNTVVPPDFATITPILDSERHNFYKAVKKVWDSNIVRSKIIASGYVPPNNMENRMYTTGMMGDNNVILTSKDSNYVDVNGFYDVPIDVKVTCNDVVKYGDIWYYYVLETDCAVGFSFYAETPGYSYTLQSSLSPLEFNFFIRGYFKDL